MKLNCFAYVDKPVRIAPASNRRAWMDDYPERHPYKCLPLQIANAYGWQLLAPYAIDVVYRGGRSPDAMSIALPAGIPADEAFVESHFGHGILTFRSGYIFRTEPGWLLMARGPANSPKDSIAPLDGLIETDWLSYPFTINWVFTRPGRVRFAAGEPFCQLVPVLQHAIEWIEPQVRDIREDPSLCDQFEKALAKRRCPAEDHGRAGNWQHDYMKGQHADGEPAPRHQKRLSLKCPVHRRAAVDHSG